LFVYLDGSKDVTGCTNSHALLSQEDRKGGRKDAEDELAETKVEVRFLGPSFGRKDRGARAIAGLSKHGSLSHPLTYARTHQIGYSLLTHVKSSRLLLMDAG
jgi:hypothetical protein